MKDYIFSEKKLYKPFSNDIDHPQILFFLKQILGKDKDFFITAIIYAIFISLLSLAVPVSVQLLINSVSFTALLQPVLVLGLMLFALLAFYGVLNAIQFYVMEIFQRRFFARMMQEISLRLLYANHRNFEESNQAELVNRFFDVIYVQKTLPKLLTKTFALLLQTLVGLVIVTFYHPLLLLFSLSIIAAIYFIWRFYYRDAFISAFYESRRKYDAVGWLEDIASNNVIFKSQKGQDYAKSKADFLTDAYLKERKRHFKNLFSQKILLLALYAIASTALLTLGGWLILKGQLTLGQLVASELIMSTILYNLSQFGYDFENIYDLTASCEKLVNFYNIPLDYKSNLSVLTDKQLNIKYHDAAYSYLGRDVVFNLEFLAQKNYLIAQESSVSQKILIESLSGLIKPLSGSLQFNGRDINDIDCYNLRSQICIIDNANFIEGTIYEYLTFNNSNITQAQIFEALKITGLDIVIKKFADGLNTRLIPSGWPLSESGKILLKVTKAIIEQPKIIIINEVLDMLRFNFRQEILDYLTKKHHATIIYFSNRRDQMSGFDEYIFIAKNALHHFDSIKDLEQFEQSF